MAATVWKGFITFGLISIPVRLYRAARPERVNLRRLYRPASVPQDPAPQRAKAAVAARPDREEEADLRPLKEASIVEGSPRPIPKEAIVKGYEYGKDRFVAVEPEEIASITPKTTSEMGIQEFVALEEIDPVYFETSYYVTPEEAGEKAYALLYRSLQLTRLVAIAEFAMHNREHVLVLRPGSKGILAHTMFYASEVRADDEFHADVSDLKARELDLAQTLIHSLAAKFEPGKYHDTYREKLAALLAGKVAGMPVDPSPAIDLSKQAEVVDIADALRRSLANLKKPAATAASAPAKKTKRAAAGRL